MVSSIIIAKTLRSSPVGFNQLSCNRVKHFQANTARYMGQGHSVTSSSSAPSSVAEVCGYGKTQRDALISLSANLLFSTTMGSSYNATLPVILSPPQRESPTSSLANTTVSSNVSPVNYVAFNFGMNIKMYI